MIKMRGSIRWLSFSRPFDDLKWIGKKRIGVLGRSSKQIEMEIEMERKDC